MKEFSCYGCRIEKSENNRSARSGYTKSIRTNIRIIAI